MNRIWGISMGLFIMIMGMPGLAFASDNNIMVGVGILILVSILIFLICREIFCWYFKINERVALLTDIRDLLKQGAVAIPASAPRASTEKKTACPKCLKELAYNAGFCESCGTKIN